jgi:hypothetical protein
MTSSDAAPKPKATPKATSKARSKAKSIYQLKITLRGSKPPIWRRVQVPGSMTLDALHVVIQIAMGWEDEHLHEFDVNGVPYAPPNPYYTDPFSARLDEARARLHKIAPEEGAKFTYEYDFGDSWSHAILVEKILDPEPDTRYPRCVAGRLACPPEDCGGIWGYYSLLDTLADPKAPDHAEMVEWIGDPFDPTAFSLDEVNAEFEMLGDIAAAARERRLDSLLGSGGVSMPPMDALNALSGGMWFTGAAPAAPGAANKPREISLDHHGYAFTAAPLLIGGAAMAWHDLSAPGKGVQFVVTGADYEGLATLHPKHLKEQRGDLGVMVEPFELWASVCRFDYDALAIGAHDSGAYRVISLEKLLLLTCLRLTEEQNALVDMLLISSRILDQQYGKA